MRKQFLKAILLSGTTLLSVNSFGQWTSLITDNYDKSCKQKTDWILDGVKNPNWYRFGILNRGVWGGTALEDQYINIGPGDLGTIASGAIIAPVDNRFYGITSTMNSDRLFVGLRARSVNGCTNNYTTDNRADGVIAWGNDSSGAFADRLIFEYHDWVYPTGGPNFQREIATMLPSGNVGIGTPSPTHQLHVKKGVRFEGLPATVFNPSLHDVIVQDASGVLYHTNITGTGGVTNLCATTDFVTKTDPSGNLVCSQIYDDGTSVGIGTTTGTVAGSFTYTLGGGYGTLLGTMAPTPPSGTVTLDVNGVSRSLAFLAYSDENLKTNVRGVEHALDIIKLMNAKTYDWNDKAKASFHADNGRHIGFIAQELSKVVPEVVVKDNQNNYSVNYTELIPILAAGIKEQQQVIEQLRAEVAALKNATNISDETGKTGFKIYPNPSNGLVAIEAGNMNSSEVMLITDLNGKMIKKVNASEFSNGSYKIEKGILVPGIYLVTMTNGASQQSQKLVITE